MEEDSGSIPLSLWNQRADAGANTLIGAEEADQLVRGRARPPPIDSPWGGVHTIIIVLTAFAAAMALGAFLTSLILGLQIRDKVDNDCDDGNNESLVLSAAGNKSYVLSTPGKNESYVSSTTGRNNESYVACSCCDVCPTNDELPPDQHCECCDLCTPQI